MNTAEIALLAVYFLSVVILAVYGVHRYVLSWHYLKSRSRGARPDAPVHLVPVTVQLPLYNERYVACRLIDAVAALDYPANLLEIQVLDDSDDDTVELVAECVAKHQQRGVCIHHVRRGTREGYKAGALAHGLESAEGELVAVFDADFVPPPDFLVRAVGQFHDHGVGMVQARWGHLNRDYSQLTETQALMLDGHFLVEHSARAATGCFFNFNGTAGIWRRDCIRDAGGWQADTLTEDLDLSYRAQLAGWRFVYLPEIEVGAEIPVEMNAFKSQQRRWAKGAIQTARKLLGRLLRSDLPPRVKREAFFHLTASISYPVMALLVVLFPATMVIRHQHGYPLGMLLEVPVLLLATGSVCTFYLVAQRFRGPRRPLEVLILMAVGAGMALSNAWAVLEALFNRDTPFVRTPKSGVVLRTEKWQGRRYSSGGWWLGAIEVGLGGYLGWATGYAIAHSVWAPLPFLALFTAGYLYVGVLSVWQGRRALKRA